jgi:hypothetical protein
MHTDGNFAFCAAASFAHDLFVVLSSVQQHSIGLAKALLQTSMPTDVTS